VNPRDYNVPFYAYFSGALAANAAWTALSPSDNQNGRWVQGANAHAFAADDDPTLILIESKQVPTFANLAEVGAELLSVSQGYPSHLAAGVFDRISSTLLFRQRRFVLPSYGLYLVARVSCTVTIAGVEFYFDNEQAGR
jgi:hypothetical protein